MDGDTARGLEALKAREGCGVREERNEEERRCETGARMSEGELARAHPTIASCKSYIIVIYTAHHPMLIITGRSVAPRPRRNEFTNASQRQDLRASWRVTLPRRGASVAHRSLEYFPFFLFVSIRFFLSFLFFFIAIP